MREARMDERYRVGRSGLGRGSVAVVSMALHGMLRETLQVQCKKMVGAPGIEPGLLGYEPRALTVTPRPVNR